MAVVEIRMGSEQNEGTESFVGLWHKKQGEFVRANEPIAEISTDKVSLEVAAPRDGVLREILKAAGDPVAPGEILALLEPASVEAVAGADADQNVPSLDLSPGVRRLIAEHKLDPSVIPASGRGGRLTIGDVDAFMAKLDGSPNRRSRFVPHSAMRRSIASRMARSLHSAPHVTAVFEADFTRVLADRAARKAAASTEEVPTLTAYMIHASVKAIQAVPDANSRWHEDRLEVFEDVNIGFGAATPDGGLIVPVIHGAQELDMPQLGARLRVLTERARAGRLARAEVEGGTFTISNHGVGGSLLAAPVVIHQEQAAILGAGKLQRRAVVNATTDAIEVKPMMYVTLTIDHRILDGRQTDAFLTRFIQVLENEV